MNSKFGTCPGCRQDKEIFQITPDHHSPTGTTKEHWLCEGCCDDFYDFLVETFGGRKS